MSKMEKIEANELEELQRKMSNVHKITELMAKNFMVEQRCKAEKAGIMADFDNAESELKALQVRFSEKYGNNIEVSLNDGVITYK